MYFNLKYLLFGIFLLIATSEFTFGQWNLTVSTLQEYSDNPFHSPFAEESFISTLNFGVEKSFDYFSAAYHGNYTNFANLTDRNYYWHQLGFWNTTNNFMYGINIEQRLNGENFNFYNYLNYSGYLRYRFNINNTYIFGNTSINVTDYSELNDLDNLFGSISLNANKSFKSKTTLIGGTTLKYKNYFNTELNSLENNVNIVANSNSAFTSQLTYYVKIAQSITPTTGLALQYTGRNIIAGTAKTIRKLQFAYGDESKYFDDPISYEGYTGNIQLSQILPWEIILRTSYFFNSKVYPSQGAYIKIDYLNTDTKRKDTQQIFNFGMQKKIYFGKTENNSLILLLNYQYINNSSNSYWYNYEVNKINLGISYNF